MEIHTKHRGTDERFQKAGLSEFMGENELPGFDTTRIWKERRDTGLRRKIYSRQRGQTEEDDHQSKRQEYRRQGLVRQLSSNSKDGEGSKKLRRNMNEVGSKCIGDNSGDDAMQDDDMEQNDKDDDEVL